MKTKRNKQFSSVSLDDVSTILYRQTPTVDIPKNVLQENRIITGLAPGVEMDAYRMLRTRVLRRMADNNWRTLGITSPMPGAGKTLTAINLSLSIAMEVTKTVLLIDADMRQPRVHRYFQLPDTTPGLSDYLLGNLDLDMLLVHPNVGRCIILPAGAAINNSSEMLLSPKMIQFVEEAKYRYPSRTVVFDLPPMLATADAVGFASQVDAILLVVEDGVTTRDDLEQCFDLLGSSKILGTVLNKSHEASKNYVYY